MRYCITGNSTKAKFWPQVMDLITLLEDRGLTYCFSESLAREAEQHDRYPDGYFTERICKHVSDPPDVILSFGGDGTMLNTAYEAGTDETPILGINIGRLGFLANVEVSELPEAISRLETGDFTTESRLVLEASIQGSEDGPPRWALNEFVIDKSGSASMISIHVSANGSFLNDYWSDGLIISTPTGSTAYSLSAGGPIMVPRSGVIAITPIAPHALTVRPIVLPDTAVIEARVTTRGNPYVFASDGRSEVISGDDLLITIRKARHHVQLIKLPDHDYYKTLRFKLMWGQRKQF